MKPRRNQSRQCVLDAHDLPRREIHHEPHSTTCACGCQRKRIGQDVAEKLDYQPDVFTLERHIRGKWVCSKSETLIQAPVPAHAIDKGILSFLRHLNGPFHVHDISSRAEFRGWLNSDSILRLRNCLGDDDVFGGEVVASSVRAVR